MSSSTKPLSNPSERENKTDKGKINKGKTDKVKSQTGKLTESIAQEEEGDDNICATLNDDCISSDSDHIKSERRESDNY